MIISIIASATAAMMINSLDEPKGERDERTTERMLNRLDNGSHMLNVLSWDECCLLIRHHHVGVTCLGCTNLKPES